MSWADRRCRPVSRDTKPLPAARCRELLAGLAGAWRISTEGHLQRSFRFADFRTAWDFAARVATLAEEENHHPELRIGWGRVEIELWTHVIQGLSENDFILAAKIDRLG